MFRYDTLYHITIGDNLGSPDTWNERFKDLDVRINACEAYQNTADAASQVIIDTGIARIDNVLQPLLNQLTTTTNQLQQQVNVLINTVQTDQDSITNQMNDLTNQANTLIAGLQSTGTFDGGTF